MTSKHQALVDLPQVVSQPGFVWKNPLRFYPAGFIQINQPGKSQKNPPEGGFF